MTNPIRPKTLLVVAGLFVAGGVVLAEQGWVSSPRLHVPPFVAYASSASLFAAAVMIAFQVAGVCRWNDLLAAVLLSGFTIGVGWQAFGSGRRTCRWGWWQPPEPVCRTMLAVCTMACAGMTIWAVRRYIARRDFE